MRSNWAIPYRMAQNLQLAADDNSSPEKLLVQQDATSSLSCRTNSPSEPLAAGNNSVAVFPLIPNPCDRYRFLKEWIIIIDEQYIEVRLELHFVYWLRQKLTGLIVNVWEAHSQAVFCQDFHRGNHLWFLDCALGGFNKCGVFHFPFHNQCLPFAAVTTAVQLPEA